jgi:DNA-binding transcriptional MocR family regulator
MGPEDVLYLVPSFQNPTGRTISHEGRKAILDVAAERNFWVIEDDAYGELRYGEHSVPALRALETAEKVIYLGSFSQLLFPGIRQGYALVPGELLKDFQDALLRSAGAVSSLLQRVVAAFLEGGHLEPCLERARSAMSSRMRQLALKLGEALPELVFEVPQGGIYLWVTFPGVSDEKLAETARNSGVEVACGRDFSACSQETFSVRLSVSRTGFPFIAKAVGRLAEAWRDLS